MLADKLRAATAAAASVEPVGIDFDGTNDYLSRSSDLVGNADGKTFTLSFWIFIDGSASIPNNVEIIRVNFFQLKYFNSEYLQLSALNSSLSPVWNMNITDVGVIPRNTWLNFIVSGDAASGVGSCYKNDILHSSFPTTVNDNIDFTGTSIWVGQYAGCRLAGVYLDYTYRDLTVEANRRDFIDAEGRYVKPPTSGIISVPMDDPEDPGRNDGTGGDFTPNGVVAQSGRGPNQYNAPASTFDGSADYLSRGAGLTGVADSKVFTFSFTMKRQSTSQEHIFHIPAAGAFRIIAQSLGAGLILFEGHNSIGTKILEAEFSGASDVIGKYFTVSVSVDMSSTSSRHVHVNGAAVSANWLAYTNEEIDLTSSNCFVGALYGSSSFWNGELSDFWFDTTYIDLSADNPFYDSETGKPKDLGVDGSNPTGSVPLIYLPLRADDAGSNKGTGGDFTVNSGPYTGARGPSEFWASSAEFNGTDQNLGRTSQLSGVSDGKAFTLAMALNIDNTSGQDYIFTITDGSDVTQYVTFLANLGDFSLSARNAAGTQILDASNAGTFSAGNWQTILISIDLTNTSNRHVYFDGSSVSVSWSTYTNDDIDFTRPNIGVADIGNSGGGYFDGKIGFFWFDTTYIDFSQEANRLKFFDAFGYPVDLGADGSLPTGNQPLIYMNNDFHLGTNLGSGGNFTPQNTPTDGGYVKG